METTLGSVELGDQRSMHIATLSHETVIENDAAHLGFDGYFLFEVSENPERKGITILGKTMLRLVPREYNPLYCEGVGKSMRIDITALVRGANT